MAELKLQKKDVDRGPSVTPVVAAWNRMPGPVVDGMIVTFFFLATALFYWRVITPDATNRATFPKGDFMEQFFTYAFFRAQELLSGRLPIWNPYSYGGQPFIADIQSAVFYPLGWLTTLIAGKDYPLIALEYEAIFHIFLACVFTYVFGRLRLWGRFPATVSALVFAFGGYLTSYPVQQLAILEVEIWFPLVLVFVHLATRQTITQQARLAFAVTGGLVLGISGLAGHPQAYSYVLYGTGLYFLFRLYELGLDQSFRSLIPVSWIPLILAIVGFGTAAIQLVPTFEFMHLSSRATATYEFTSWGFPLSYILQIILPGSASSISPMYVGIFPLVLAVLSVQHRRSRPVIFWSLVAGAALMLSFGGHTFLYSLFYLAAPGFSTFRDQERAIFLTSFALAQLAGYGAFFIMDQHFPQERILKAARVLLWSCLGVLSVLVVASLLNATSGKLEDQVGIVAFLLIILFLSFVLVQTKGLGLPGIAFAFAATTLILLDLFSVNWKNNLEEKNPEEYFQSTPLIQYLQEHRSEGRVYNENQLPLNYGSVYGIEDVNGASPLVLERYKSLFLLPQQRLWQILNVRYFLTWQGGYDGGKKISVENSMNLYELPDPLPRASVVHDARVEATDLKALEILASPQFDPSKTVILAEDPPLALPGPGVRSTQATLSRPRPSSLRIETNDPDPGILLLSEVFYPGWKVTVDGKPSTIIRADVALRGVPLSGGPRLVEMTFEPNSLKLGSAITGSTLASSLLLLVLSRLWPRKRSS